MSERVRRLFGYLTAAVLLLSAIAHAIAGGELGAALAAAGVAGDLAGPLAVGWYFGSLAMAVFGLMVLTVVLRRSDPAPLRWIAAGYVLFGAVAFVVRDLNPHFLLFVTTGLLCAAFAFGRRQ